MKIVRAPFSKEYIIYNDAGKTKVKKTLNKEEKKIWKEILKNAEKLKERLFKDEKLLLKRIRELK